MYSPATLAIKYLNYLLTAQNGRGHGIHSPFVFHFIKEILNDPKKYEPYHSVEQLRNELLERKQLIEINDLGAGSRRGVGSKRSIASIAKNVVKPKKYGQLLFRISKAYKPETIVELGTSLGITTAYLAAGNEKSNVYSIEGAGAVAKVAVQNLQQLGIQNVTVIAGDFEDNLPTILKQVGIVDMAFIDGNHREEPTMRYFDILLSGKNNNSVFIFDDIHWSKEMENAWRRIKNHPSVTCSIDLFFIGLVFFRNEFKQRQHFKIRF